MTGVAERLEAMDALLRRSVALRLSRPTLEGALRREIHEITKLRLETGYSPELEAADVALTNAITAFRHDESEAGLEQIRARMSDYRRAALSSEFRHSPMRSLVELGFGRMGWDAAVQAARG